MNEDPFPETRRIRRSYEQEIREGQERIKALEKMVDQLAERIDELEAENQCLKSQQNTVSQATR